jgi:hypothetical protein
LYDSASFTTSKRTLFVLIAQMLTCGAACVCCRISATGNCDCCQELLLLLPDLASLLPSLHPRTLALLGSDTQGVAQKLVRGTVL